MFKNKITLRAPVRFGRILLDITDSDVGKPTSRSRQPPVARCGAGLSPQIVHLFANGVVKGAARGRPEGAALDETHLMSSAGRPS